MGTHAPGRQLCDTRRIRLDRQPLGGPDSRREGRAVRLSGRSRQRRDTLPIRPCRGFRPGLCRCPASGQRGNARSDRANGPVGHRTHGLRPGGRRRGRGRGGLRRFRTCRVFPHYRGWRGAHRGPGTVRGRYGGPAAPRGCLGTGEAGRWDDPDAAVFRRHAPAPPGRRGAAVPAVRGLCGGGISPGRTV